ncbi:MAG: DUF6077 domain-containing protein [Actinomycetota bacterium]|nr:DUF6077 domain-containing protein [Actinomycetota bacterium]
MKRISSTRSPRFLDAAIVASSGGALILLGPLRGVVDAFPLVAFLSALVLFLVPGVLLSHWYLGEYFSGAALVPVSFAISTSIFGLLGVPMLIVHLGLGAYLILAAAVLAGFLAKAVIRTLRGLTPEESKGSAPSASSFDWLWIPFALLGAVLAAASAARAPFFYDDIWVYLAWVREFLSTDKLALYEPYFGHETDLSRVMIDGWLLEQAALSWASGVDSIELVLDYLTPTLVVVALLAFYALARALFRSEAAALISGCLLALYYLVNLEPSLLSSGGEFVGRMAEDKFVARFVFLPVALALAVAFLRSRKPRYLAVFAFICCAVVVVHPVGVAIIGLSMAGFGLLYLALNLRRREAWAMMVALGVPLLAVVLFPAAIIFMATGESLTTVLSDADINSHDPDVLANMVFVKPGRERIFELGEDSYIMHPSLVLDPVILGAYLLGLPFLVRRLRHHLAAQLLAGTLVLIAVVCYVPPIATFLGDHVVVPGQLWRLAWPIPLAALLTVGWMGWEATRRARAGLEALGIRRRVTLFVPVVLVGAMAAVATPTIVAGAEDIYRTGEVPGRCSPADPVFGWMRDNIKEPSVVLAPDAENTCIPAYSASAKVVSLRGGLILDVLPALERRAPGQIDVPQRVLDLRSFFHDSTLDEEILRRYKVDYVLLYENPSLERQLENQPGITAIETPGDSYSLYAVDTRRLGE